MVLAVVVRRLGLFVLLLSSGRIATAGEPLGSHEVARPPLQVVDLPELPLGDAPESVASLDLREGAEPEDALEPEGDPEAAPPLELDLREIHWTVDEPQSVDALASRWGMLHRDLVALNPELRGRATVEAGEQLRVYEHDETLPTQSIGSPNRGRLRHGLPMPEGAYWTLRERRTRAFGAVNAIGAMVEAFTRYGESFEVAPPVSVGEISARRGGRALPHRSHRTGRDVDLGYVLVEGTEAERWRRADEANFDVEKNWVLIQSLVATGEVQQIFISSRLQRLLKPLAREQLSEREYARYFRVADSDADEAPLLKHWDGHRDHMHVRFRCEDGNGRCRSRSSKARRRS